MFRVESLCELARDHYWPNSNHGPTAPDLCLTFALSPPWKPLRNLQRTQKATSPHSPYSLPCYAPAINRCMRINERPALGLSGRAAKHAQPNKGDCDESKTNAGLRWRRGRLRFPALVWWRNCTDPAVQRAWDPHPIHGSVRLFPWQKAKPMSIHFLW